LAAVSGDEYWIVIPLAFQEPLSTVLKGTRLVVIGRGCGQHRVVIDLQNAREILFRSPSNRDHAGAASKGAFFPSRTFTITANVRKTSLRVRALMAQTLILHEVVPALSTWLKILSMSPEPTGVLKSNGPKSFVTKFAAGNAREPAL
jgi:hypothetical protein